MLYILYRNMWIDRYLDILYILYILYRDIWIDNNIFLMLAIHESFFSNIPQIKFNLLILQKYHKKDCRV